MTTEAEFVSRYSGIYEHSPWVAEEAAPDAAGTDKLHRIAEIMADCVDNASTERQLALIRAHPDLAGKVREIRIRSTPMTCVSRHRRVSIQGSSFTSI